MPLILVIDDDADIRTIVDLALRQADYDVVTSDGSGDQVALALQHGADAVVLDIAMPHVSGFDVLRAFRDEPLTSGLPVLFLSAHGGQQDRVRGLKEGADDYLSKPFSPDELVLRVERLIDRPPQVDTSSFELTDELRRCLDAKKVVAPLHLGRYEAVEVVGEGAMGLVFKGWDPQLDRPVALKVLSRSHLKGLTDRSAEIAQLLHEAATVARFSHPNIVAVHDVAAGPEMAFMAMEFVDGLSLADILCRGPLSAEQIVILAQRLARALDAAHGHHILHCDVKPANVLLGYNGSIKLSDFGIANFVSSLQGKGVFGTLGYIPPEVLTLKGYSERGDLFALGVTLYQCVTGKPAFGKKDFLGRLRQTLEEDPEPIRDLAPDTPEELERLVYDLLEKEPERRPESAAAVIERLQPLRDPQASWQPPSRRAKLDVLPFGTRSSFMTQEQLTEAMTGPLPD